MASRLNPYISFGDDALEALTFYQQVLGGTVVVNTFGEYGATEEPLASMVMHGQLETQHGFTLMAADTPPGMSRTPGDNITISLSGDDVDELRGWFTALAAGGTVGTPLEKQMWGDEFGQLTDRFGISWLVNISGDAVAQEGTDA